MIASKQILKLISGLVRVNSKSLSVSATTVTTEVTTALTTAGYNGGAVTVAVSANETLPGIITAAPNNKVEVYDSTSKQKISNSGNEVYGRLTASAGNYTLTLYYLNGGVETAYTPPSPITVDFEFNYRFQLKDLPTDFFIKSRTLNVYQDSSNAGGTAGRTVKELLTVTAPNTVTNLSFAPNVISNVTLYVNGKEETQVGATPSFATVGTSITWSAVNAKYALATDDEVIASYTTNE